MLERIFSHPSRFHQARCCLHPDWRSHFCKHVYIWFPIPFTDIKLFKKTVKRGDIVIFPYPQDPSIDYIKGPVGLPGETLEIRNDQVLLMENGLRTLRYFEPNEGKSRQAQGIAAAPSSR
ncbi:MAG: hypothetical protein CM1200mP28_04720 [Deltaproteobacteria bacterium]|nr:MAG: hypothetical protein CM1200mP28_04720 [Deltaproteobacteria bacterium]